MFKRSILVAGLFSSAALYGHHAACVTSPEDGFMICGAHSGRVSFELQNYGDITEDTKQVVLCSNQPVAISGLEFSWVESDDASTHFPMKGLRYRQISDTCSMVGGLDFTPPADFKNSPQNAWKLEINVEGVDIPSAVYVEALPTEVK